MPQPWTESSARLGLADQSQEDRLQQGVQPNHLQRARNPRGNPLCALQHNQAKQAQTQMNLFKLTSRAALTMGALVLATATHANCFTVHDGAGKLILQTMGSPVDLSRPLGDTVPQQFGPGSHLVFSADGSDCPVISARNADQRPSTDETANREFQAYESTSADWIHATQPGSAWNDGPRASGGSAYSGGSRSARGPIHIGPRGGQYTITSTGNKNYVSRGGGRRR